MDILVDFDNTCMAGDFPIVKTDIGSVPVLKRLIEEGHRLILWTCRSDNMNKKVVDNGLNVVPISGNFLTEAVDWFKDNDIPLYGIQRHPLQDGFTSSPKAFGDMTIDDTTLGAPVMVDLNISKKPFIDWKWAESMLEMNQILTDKSKK